MIEELCKIFRNIREFFRTKCPDCNGTLEYEFTDTDIDRDVHKCDQCDELFIGL